MTRALAVAALALLSGCGSETGEAQLLVPDDLEIHWDASFNGTEDGLAALVPVDVMVYDGATGEPVGAVPLEIQGTDPGALLALPSAIDLVSGEESDDAWWDAWHDRYFHLVDDASSTLATETDPTGLARVYLLVDRLDREDGAFAPAAVTVSMGVAEESFLLVPR